jgi:hypothetical protein
MTEMTPYSTVIPFGGVTVAADTTAPDYVPWLLDQQRVQSYRIYEQVYWNVPETFKLVARGSEDKPIYLLSGRKIVNVCDRYTGNNFQWVASTPEAQLAFDNLFTREAFLSNFYANKLYGIMRGDWLWHITANPNKAAGSRITIRALDPGSYFTITDPNDVDRVIGCHIIELIEEGSDVLVKRLTYLKNEPTTAGGTPIITSQIATYKLDEWGDVDAKSIQQIQPLMPLDPRITALPVYHIRNFIEPQNPFGSSELRGMERLIAALNQSISDEDLTLAMDGLGMYSTNAKAVDENGDDTEWDIGPAKVQELNGTKSEVFFDRITGVSSVSPYQDHLAFLKNDLMEGSGTPDIATGKVDVSVAESGVALLLQLAPILTKGEQKDRIIIDVHNQMFFDLLNGWLPAYEQMTFPEGTTVTAHVGDKLPFNRKQRFEELLAMLNAKVIDTQYFREEMSKLGYQFPEDMITRIQNEQQTLADPMIGRLAAEIGSSNGSSGS